jgi:tripartite-type tricarboxylate transporter receptor subunit TctC
MIHRLFATFAVSFSCLLLLCTNSSAQAASLSYPERAVRIIVPFPAGGATDVVARMVADHLAQAWSKPVIVDNVTGAAGATGTALAAKAPPDGHTLLVATGTTMTLLPHLRSNLPFDPVRDFAAVSLMCSFPNLLVVRPDLAATSVAELIALVRAAPGKYSYASTGYGASPHLAAEWFKFLSRSDILHVPYTGSGPALPALLGGHVDMMFDTMPSVWPQVLDGKLRALGVTTAERVPFLGDLPAIAETLPGFDVASWLGIVVPAGTPGEVRAEISTQLVRILREPALAQRLKELGAVARSTTPEEFSDLIRSDFQKWGRVTRETGIRLEK